MFSKPFVASLEGHGDGLYAMTKDESGGLSRIGSGSGDGEIRVWDLAQRKTLWHAEGAHRGMVKGVAFSHPAAGEEGRVEKKVGGGEKSHKRKRTELGDKGKGRQDEPSDDEEGDDFDTTVARGSSRFLSCGVDKTVKLWDVTGPKGSNVKVSRHTLSPPRSSALTSLLLFRSLCKLIPASQASSRLIFLPSRSTSCSPCHPSLSSISHHRYDPIFATASTSIDIWDENNTSPLSTLKFHSTSNLSSGEHIVNVAFNKSETSVLASSGSDRTVCLYDLRSGKALGRVSMNVRGDRGQHSSATTDPPCLTDARQPARLQPSPASHPPLRLGRSQPLHLRHAQLEHHYPGLQGSRWSVSCVRQP